MPFILPKILRNKNLILAGAIVMFGLGFFVISSFGAHEARAAACTITNVSGSSVTWDGTANVAQSGHGTATWSGCTQTPGFTPATGDSFTVPSGITLTLTGNALVSAVTMASPTAANNLIITNGFTLTISGALSFTANATANAQTVTLGTAPGGAGNITTGSISAPASTSTGASKITCFASSTQTGTLTVTGTTASAISLSGTTVKSSAGSSIDMSPGACNVTMSGTGGGITLTGSGVMLGAATFKMGIGTATLNTGGLVFSGTTAGFCIFNMSANGGTLVLNGSTIPVVGTCGSYTFTSTTNIINNSGSSAFNYATAVTGWGTCTVTAGTLTFAAAETCTSVSVSGTLDMGVNLLTDNGNLTVNGTLTGNTGGVSVPNSNSILDGTGNVSNSGPITLGTLANTGLQVAATANLTLNNLTINVATDVTILSGATLTISNGLTYTATNNNTNTQALNVNSGATLSILGGVTMNQPTTTIANKFYVNGTATVAGTFSMPGNSSTGNRNQVIELGATGDLKLNGGINVLSGAPQRKFFYFSGAGSLTIAGDTTTFANVDLTYYNSPFTANSVGTIIFKDTSAQTIRLPRAGNFVNLQVINTVSSTLASAFTASNITGNFTVGDGSTTSIFKNGGFAFAGTGGATFEVKNNGTFEMSGTSTYPTGFTTFTYGTSSTVRYLQTNGPTVTNASYGNLELKPAGATAIKLPGTLNTIAGNLVIGDSTNTGGGESTTNNPTININGSMTINNASTFAQGSGEIIIVGNLFVGNGSTTASFVGSSGTISVSGNILIDDKGSLTAPSTTLTIGGNFTTTGIFTHNSGLVTFTGSPTLNGSTNFYGFSATTPGAVVTFTAGQTFGIGGYLTVTGTSGSKITFTSTSTSAWNITTTGMTVANNSVTALNLNYVNCTASSPVIAATFSVFTSHAAAANEACWSVGAGALVSGVVYQSDGSTVDGTARSIKVSVNGGTAQSISSTVTTGAFQAITATAPADGDIITIWITGGSPIGTLVLKYGASCTGTPNCTGLSLVENRVWLLNDHTSAVTNFQLSSCDNNAGTGCNDSNIGFDSDGVNATFSTSRSLYISGTNGYGPGGTVTTAVSNSASSTTGDLIIASSSTLDMGGNALSVGGDFTNNGTYSKVSSAQTTTFTATATGHTINLGTGNFGMVIVNGTNGGWSFSDSSNTIDGNLTLNVGAVTVSGDLDVQKIQLDGSTTLTMTGSSNLTLAASGTNTACGQSDSNPLCGTGTLSGAPITTFNGTSASLITARTYGDLTLDPGTNSITYTLGSGTITAASMTLGNSSNTGIIIDGSGNNPAVNLTNLTITSGTQLRAGSGTWTIGGGFTNNGTFTHNNGTVVLNNAITNTVSGSSNTTFYNFTENQAGSTLTFASGKTYVFAGALNLSGTNGNNISLSSSSSGSQWYAQMTGTATVTYINIQDSACLSGLTLATDATRTDLGNNGSCWGFAYAFVIHGNSGPTGGGPGAGGSNGGGGQNGNGLVQAVATAVLSGGSISSVNITNGGSGYTTAPRVCFQDATGSGGVATATISSGVVTLISVSNGGANYSNAVVVSIAAPPGDAGNACASGGGSGGGGGGATP